MRSGEWSGAYSVRTRGRIANPLVAMSKRGVAGGFVGGSFSNGSGSGGGGGEVDPWGGQVVSQASGRTRPALLYSTASIVTNWARSDDAALVSVAGDVSTRAAAYRFSTPVTIDDGSIDRSRTAAQIIQTCCVAGIATGTEAYFTRAITELMSLIAWSTTGVQFLTITERAFGLAVGYEFLYSRLSSGQRTSVQTALTSQFLNPYLAGSGSNPELWDPNNGAAQVNPNNWTAEVNATALISALAICDSWPSANLALNKARSGLDIYFGYLSDGSSRESASYGGGYALGFCNAALDSIRRATGEQTLTITEEDANLGLAAEWYAYEIGQFGLQYAHSDGAELADPHMLDGFFAGSLFGVPAAQAASRILSSVGTFKASASPSGVAWWSGPSNNDALVALTPSKQWPTSREVRLSSGWTGQPILWIRGGVGNWPHACQDRGVFSLDLGGVRWTQGNDAYSQGLTKPNTSFALLVVGGSTQSLNGYATIESANTVLTGGHPRTVIDLTHVGDPASLAWRRRAYLEDDYTVLVTDQFTGPNGTGWSWYWPVAGLSSTPTGGSRSITLSKGGKQLKLYAPAGFVWAVATAGTNAQGATIHKLSLSGTCTGGSDTINVYAQLVDPSAPDVTTLVPPAMP